MSPSKNIIYLTGGVIVPLALTFLGKAVQQMIPWLIVMVCVIITDLAAGLWKSYKLEIPIRFSKACRETMGKTIVYFAFVIMACVLNVASGGDFNWAKWLSLFVILIETGSIISNILKPHGINISMNAIVKAILTHSALPFACPNVDELLVKEDIDKIRQEELEKLAIEKKWKGKKSSRK